MKLIPRLSTLVILGSHPEIWTLCTIRKYIFLVLLEELAIIFPFMTTLISQAGPLVFLRLVGWVRGPLAGSLRP